MQTLHTATHTSLRSTPATAPTTPARHCALRATPRAAVAARATRGQECNPTKAGSQGVGAFQKAAWRVVTPALVGALSLNLLLAPLAAGAFTYPQEGRGVAPSYTSAFLDDVPKSLELDADEAQTVTLFERNTPCVVNITNVQMSSSFTLDSRFVPVGSGSGFIWDDEGHIVTNFHVVRGASQIRVTLIDQSAYQAKVVGKDEDKDLAVLKLIDVDQAKLKQLKSVNIGKSSTLKVGQKVYAIGNPFGLDHTLTQGIISGVGRQLSSGNLGIPIKNVIQTDAAINPGNSGGVLLDSRGRLIGINTAIADPTGRGANTGVGFAIPIDAVKGEVSQILRFGRVMRPVLGVTLAPPMTLQQLKLEGLLILDIAPGGPGDEAGLQGTIRGEYGLAKLGDIIYKVDGVKIENVADLYEILEQKQGGDIIKVTVKRNLGQEGGRRFREFTVPLKLVERGGVAVPPE